MVSRLTIVGVAMFMTVKVTPVWAMRWAGRIAARTSEIATPVHKRRLVIKRGTDITRPPVLFLRERQENTLKTRRARELMLR
jgi:hypothetical protein